MREIVNIQIGNCGNAIGSEFWKLICGEHGIDQSGVFCSKNPILQEKINVYFNETKGCTYTPRSVMIDLDIFSMEAVRSSVYGKIFKPENFIFGTTGSSNIWPRGHFTEGVELAGTALDVIRKEVENCDCFHGFQMMHSIGGGTGGGLGSLLICQLKDEYPDRILTTFSVIPSPEVPALVVEPYNALLSLNHLIESTNETFCINNEALYNILSKKLKLENQSYFELNQMISFVISGITTCIRFPSTTNSDLRKIAVNMVPFPRLHFFIPGFAPLMRRNGSKLRKPSLIELISDLFDYRNLFAACDARKGKFLTVGCIFRGNISTKEIDNHMYNIQNKNSANFNEWIPSNIKTALCYSPPPGFTKSATFIGNTTAIQEVFKRVKNQFDSMYKRGAFLHWYLGEGLEELEFEASESNLNDLILEYEENEKHVAEIKELKDCYAATSQNKLNSSSEF